MTRLAFIDTETTGLDPHRARVWELAYIIRDPETDDTLEHAFLDVPLDKADPQALKVGQYYQRHPDPHRLGGSDVFPEPAFRVWGRLAHDLTGAVLCGFNPAFDAAIITAELARYGLAPTWHYAVCDVVTMAGVVGNLPMPYKTADALARFGVTVPDGARHTALGDVLASVGMFDAVRLRTAVPA